MPSPTGQQKGNHNSDTKPSHVIECSDTTSAISAAQHVRLPSTDSGIQADDASFDSLSRYKGKHFIQNSNLAALGQKLFDCPPSSGTTSPPVTCSLVHDSDLSMKSSAYATGESSTDDVYSSHSSHSDTSSTLTPSPLQSNMDSSGNRNISHVISSSSSTSSSSESPSSVQPTCVWNSFYNVSTSSSFHSQRQMPFEQSPLESMKSSWAGPLVSQVNSNALSQGKKQQQQQQRHQQPRKVEIQHFSTSLHQTSSNPLSVTKAVQNTDVGKHTGTKSKNSAIVIPPKPKVPPPKKPMTSPNSRPIFPTASPATVSISSAPNSSGHGGNKKEGIHMTFTRPNTCAVHSSTSSTYIARQPVLSKAGGSSQSAHPSPDKGVTTIDVRPSPGSTVSVKVISGTVHSTQPQPKPTASVPARGDHGCIPLTRPLKIVTPSSTVVKRTSPRVSMSQPPPPPPHSDQLQQIQQRQQHKHHMQKSSSTIKTKDLKTKPQAPPKPSLPAKPQVSPRKSCLGGPSNQKAAPSTTNAKTTGEATKVSIDHNPKVQTISVSSPHVVSNGNDKSNFQDANSKSDTTYSNGSLIFNSVGDKAASQAPIDSKDDVGKFNNKDIVFEKIYDQAPVVVNPDGEETVLSKSNLDTNSKTPGDTIKTKYAYSEATNSRTTNSLSRNTPSSFISSVSSSSNTPSRSSVIDSCTFMFKSPQKSFFTQNFYTKDVAGGMPYSSTTNMHNLSPDKGGKQVRSSLSPSSSHSSSLGTSLHGTGSHSRRSTTPDDNRTPSRNLAFIRHELMAGDKQSRMRHAELINKRSEDLFQDAWAFLNAADDEADQYFSDDPFFSCLSTKSHNPDFEHPASDNQRPMRSRGVKHHSFSSPAVTSKASTRGIEELLLAKDNNLFEKQTSVSCASVDDDKKREVVDNSKDGMKPNPLADHNGVGKDDSWKIRKERIDTALSWLKEELVRLELR